MGVVACMQSQHRRQRQEAPRFRASLGYRVRHCLKQHDKGLFRAGELVFCTKLEDLSSALKTLEKKSSAVARTRNPRQESEASRSPEFTDRSA